MNARAHHDRECQQIADQWRDAARVLAVLTAAAVTSGSATVEITGAQILRRLGAEPGARAGRGGSSGVWTRDQSDGIDGAIVTLSLADLVDIVRAAETIHDRWIIEIVQ